MLSVWRSAVAGVAGAVIGLAVFALGYARNPSIALEMDRGVSGIVTGLHDSERVGQETFAWTRGSATMRLPGLDRREEWSCTVRVRGGRADESTLPHVLFSVDGIIVQKVQTTNEYQDVTVAVPPGPLSSVLTVTLTASNTFVPGASDPRILGVMVDRWTCAPSSAGFVRPPWRALVTAAAGGAAFGAAFGLLSSSLLASVSGTALIAILQMVPLAWGFGPFAAYTDRAIWLALWTAGLLVISVRGAEWGIGRSSSGAARFVAASAAAVLYLKLLALLHPSKPIIDAVFHAHRLQWVLDGRFYFTQPMPSGVRFPYAIGLYVFSAPWSLLTRDYVLLLRIVVSAAEAFGALLIYLLVSRVWRDRFSGVIAAVLFHMVPRTFEIVGNANMTNAFGQSLALAVLTAAVLFPLQRGNWLQLAALSLLTAWALLSHISTLTLLGAILLILAALYRFKGGEDLRRPALSVLTALIIAATASIAIYYAHFGEAYRSAARVRAASEPITSDSPSQPGSAPVPGLKPPGNVRIPAKALEAAKLSVAAVGWPIFLLAIIGTIAFLRRGVADRLSLAIASLFVTFVAFAAGVILMPVEKSFQRYAAEFITRVTLATYPGAVILAGLGVTSAWRAGWSGRVTASALFLWASYVGGTIWIDWLR